MPTLYLWVFKVTASLWRRRAPMRCTWPVHWSWAGTPRVVTRLTEAVVQHGKEHHDENSGHQPTALLHSAGDEERLGSTCRSAVLWLRIYLQVIIYNTNTTTINHSRKNQWWPQDVDKVYEINPHFHFSLQHFHLLMVLKNFPFWTSKFRFWKSLA